MATRAQSTDCELVGLRIQRIINSPAAQKLRLANGESEKN
jgi:hypothetical protein